jgi:alpha-N-arabinofuranosidase
MSACSGDPVPSGPVRPGARVRGFRHAFACAARGGARQDPAGFVAPFLAPLFTGVQLGGYATSHGRPSTRRARFPWIDLTYSRRRKSSCPRRSRRKTSSS